MVHSNPMRTALKTQRYRYKYPEHPSRGVGARFRVQGLVAAGLWLPFVDSLDS